MEHSQLIWQGQRERQDYLYTLEQEIDKVNYTQVKTVKITAEQVVKLTQGMKANQHSK